MIKNIIIILLISCILFLVVKNHMDRKTDRLIQRIEFQKLLNELQPVRRILPEKIHI